MNDELLELLKQRGLEQSILNLLEKQPTTNIEELLARIDLEISKTPEPSGGMRSLEAYRYQIDQQIAQIFAGFRFNERLLEGKTWPKIFATNFIQRDDVIVSLNYSCLLEGLLDFFSSWSPRGGYGDCIRNTRLHDDTSFRHNAELKNISILKIHGSEHFRQALVIGQEQPVIEFLFDPSIFPGSARNIHVDSVTQDHDAALKRHALMGGDRGAYVIAPSYIKVWNAQLYSILVQSLRAAQRARDVIIIGSRLRPEDSFLSLLIFTYLMEGSLHSRRITIVDPDAAAIRSRFLRVRGTATRVFEREIESVDKKLEDFMVEKEKTLSIT